MKKQKKEELKNLTKENMEKKLKELKMELVKSKSSASQGGTLRTGEIKKTLTK